MYQRQQDICKISLEDAKEIAVSFLAENRKDMLENNLHALEFLLIAYLELIKDISKSQYVEELDFILNSKFLYDWLRKHGLNISAKTLKVIVKDFLKKIYSYHDLLFKKIQNEETFQHLNNLNSINPERIIRNLNIYERFQYNSSSSQEVH